MSKKFKHLTVQATDDTFLFLHGEKSFLAKKSEEHSNTICFFSYNEKPFDLVAIRDPDLLIADMYLKEEGFHFTLIEYEDDQYSFPLFETLEPLQEINEDIQMLFVDDIYDGPISGVIKHQNELYWFDWCQDRVTEAPHRGRNYSLRKLPADLIEPIEMWAKKYNELNTEYRLLANPHIYPVSDWQKQNQKSLSEIEDELEKHNEFRVDWRQIPITAWMPEVGYEFACIQTFTLSEEDSNRFEQWQKDVADAIGTEDQAALDRLFVRSIGPLDEYDIFRVDIVKEGRPVSLLRDFKGQALPEKFWMTGRHRIQDLTYIYKK